MLALVAAISHTVCTMQWSFQLPRLTSRFGATVSDFERLEMIRVPLILLIVFFHNDRSGDFMTALQGTPVATGIVHLVAYGLAGIRVPTFFLISGYVFFRSMKPTRAWFERKIDARTRSVLVPLLLWNVIGLVILGVAQRLPYFSQFLRNHSEWNAPVGDFTAAQYFTAIFGTPVNQPLIYPLWFLRDLFLLVLLTPVVYWAIKASRGWATLAVVVAWACTRNPYWGALDAFFFFFIGCHIAIWRKSLFLFDGLGIIAAMVWCVLEAVDMSYPLEWQAGKLKSVFGVIAVLYCSGWLMQWPAYAKLMARATRYSFFMFVAHEPLLTITRKLFLRLIGPNTALQWLSLYFAVVVVVVAVLVMVFKVLERHCPVALFYLTGGRASPPPRFMPAAGGALVP